MCCIFILISVYPEYKLFNVADVCEACSVFHCGPSANYVASYHLNYLNRYKMLVGRSVSYKKYLAEAAIALLCVFIFCEYLLYYIVLIQVIYIDVIKHLRILIICKFFIIRSA